MGGCRPQHPHLTSPIKGEERWIGVPIKGEELVGGIKEEEELVGASLLIPLPWWEGLGEGRLQFSIPNSKFYILNSQS